MPLCGLIFQCISNIVLYSLEIPEPWERETRAGWWRRKGRRCESAPALRSSEPHVVFLFLTFLWHFPPQQPSSLSHTHTETHTYTPTPPHTMTLPTIRGSIEDLERDHSSNKVRYSEKFQKLKKYDSEIKVNEGYRKVLLSVSLIPLFREPGLTMVYKKRWRLNMCGNFMT